MGLDHAALRIAMLMAPIYRPESVDDQILQLRITENLRSTYEDLTQTHESHRSSFSEDIEDIYLMVRLLANGPPNEGAWVCMISCIGS